jgi:hypothetical protein
MKTLILRVTNLLLTLSIGAALALPGISETWAQEKHQISFKNLGENTKYTEQHAINVGDVPGHQIRVFEIHFTYPNDPPVFEGLRVVESWSHGYSDYIDTNGRHWGYITYVLENGDKIFARNDGSSQTIVNPNGAKKSTATGVTTLTGGTGKFRGIQGTLRYISIFDPQAGLNEGKNEGTYSLEK